MKRFSLLLILISALFIACKHELTPFEQVIQSEPIKPLMLSFSGESQTVEFVDYIPTLMDMNFDRVMLDSFVLDAEKKSVVLDPMSQMLVLMSSKQVPLLSFRKGEDVLSVVALPQEAPHKQVMYIQEASRTGITIVFTEEPKEPQFLVMWQNKEVSREATAVDEKTFVVPFPTDCHKAGRSFVRVYAMTDEYICNDLLLPLDNMKPIRDAKRLTRHDPQSQVLYSLMVDRFEDGNTKNNWKMNSPEVLDIVDYQGGDLKGITKRIEDGFFNDLGITTIWISPITQNPWDAWGKYIFQDNDDGSFNNKYDPSMSYTRFSGYHGYWPIYSTKVDTRLGTDQELKEMLSVAHKHELNVILDYVANHLHIHSPTIQQHPDWITDSILPDGRRNFELWDEARLTTWFDAHIPTLDLEREEVYEPMTDSALYWIEHFDFDGFRHDACKHIPEVYWRTLTQKMKQRFPNRQLWMIGETYGSPELIGSYVKTGMLDAQFDFNVYFTAIHAIIDADGDMREVNRVIEESQKAYGSHHTMGNISGNHDQVRIISLAGGAVSFEENGKEAGWTRYCGVGNAKVAYKKALLLEALNMTIPGVPCIYQGDEYGQPGGNDPDNRLMMRFSDYSKEEAQMRESVSSLIKQRRSSMPLMYGEYLPLIVEKNLLCFKRVYLGQETIVAINTADQKQMVEVEGQTFEVEPLGYVIK